MWEVGTISTFYHFFVCYGENLLLFLNVTASTVICAQSRCLEAPLVSGWAEMGQRRTWCIPSVCVFQFTSVPSLFFRHGRDGAGKICICATVQPVRNETNEYSATCDVPMIVMTKTVALISLLMMFGCVVWFILQ